MNAVVQLKGVGKRLGDRWILTGIDLSIAPGESVALFGGNGSGKSTLLKILATLIQPTAGQLRILGLDPRRESREIREKIGMVAHEKQLYGSLTVLETMQLAARLRGRGGEVIRGLLERFGLARHQDRRIGHLSEGMKKRLVLARLAAGEQELILLDEPHPTLDREGRVILDEMISSWRKAGKSLLLASHDHAEALAHADRLLVMEAGRIVYDGPPKGEPQ